jgi:hypothetical protein
MEAFEILEAIRALPREARVRLVSRALADVASEPTGDPRALIGMMADEPDVMDRVCELAMQLRGLGRSGSTSK